MKNSTANHQYVERESQEVITEKLVGDRSVRLLYHSLRENAPVLFRMLTSSKMSSILGFVHYDIGRMTKIDPRRQFLQLGADWCECVEPLKYFNSMRRIFERKIRYWQVRPMDEDMGCVVSPADARVLIGSYAGGSPVFIKNKFFEIRELVQKACWYSSFLGGDYAIFRLTPDKYHYNHLPVSGRVIDCYEVDGGYHSCNPTAQLVVASVCAKNRRVVTIIDTDVEGGSQVGHVAMVEIVALMIGDIAQLYSKNAYENPEPVGVGMFVRRGCPKSLFRPGSSTVVLLFEPGRIIFSDDLVVNAARLDVQSRYSSKLGTPLVETDVRVRSTIARVL